MSVAGAPRWRRPPGLAFGREVQSNLERLLDRIDVEHFEIDVERRFCAARRRREDGLDGWRLVVEIREQGGVARDQGR